MELKVAENIENPDLAGSGVRLYFYGYKSFNNMNRFSFLQAFPIVLMYLLFSAFIFSFHCLSIQELEEETHVRHDRLGS